MNGCTSQKRTRLLSAEFCRALGAAMVDQLDPYEIVKCKGCGKDVFPSERNVALKAIWYRLIESESASLTLAIFFFVKA